MPIESAFILAAGLGTRMGEIGQTLPKVLWPFFETTLLGLQIVQLRELGFKSISVNLHHHASGISNYLKMHFPDVQILIETELLGSGGGIHNYMRKLKPTQKFLCMNSDQFINLSKSMLQEMSDTRSSVTLLGLNHNPLYPSLVLNQEMLVRIDRSSNGPMFSGVSVVDPTQLQNVDGISQFFDTVANFNKNKIRVLSKECDYYDFGTVENYFKNCFKLFRARHQYQLISQNIDEKKCMGESYFATGALCLNFSKVFCETAFEQGLIILDESETTNLRLVKDSVLYQNKIYQV